MLGNGPSLNDVDFSLLDGLVTVGVNQVPRIFDPDYLVWLDAKFMEDNAELVSTSRAEKFAACKIRLPHHYRRFGKYVPKRGQPMLADAFERGLYWSFTSVFPAISLAYVFGARAILLAGVDLRDNSHFYSDDGAGERFANSDRIMKDFKRLARFARERGLEIINVSLSSALDCFPRVPLDEALELVDKRATARNRAVNPAAGTQPKGFTADRIRKSFINGLIEED